MAISDAQKVDYLFKKLGFGVAKTDTSTNKSPANESISSPLLIRGDSMYIAADQITSTATLPTSNVASVYSVYRDTLSSSVQATNDGTAATNRTWKTNLTDWIGPEFGAGYQVKVYTGSGGTTSTAQTLTALPIDGSGNNDSWFFDYQAGVLNFADTNVPSSIGSQIWVVGVRYVGGRGVAALTAGAANTGNVSYFDNVTAFTTNQIFYPQFSNISTSGNTIVGVNSSLGYNPSTGTLSTTIVNAAHNGSIGATTPNTAVFTTTTTGGLQAVQIGNVTPGTAVFTTATTGGLQAVQIGNVTPGTGAFTTGTFNTATTGGLQAVQIGNVTPGTGAFTTMTAGSLQGIIGNTAATTAFFTTANATNLYAATIGNASSILYGSTATITNWANITATTAATSTTTGALIVAGGIGVAGNVYSGYTVTAANIQTTGSNGNISGVSNLFTSNVIATNVNAVTIGNTGAAITGNAGTLTSLQVTAIGNVTPGSAVFTTANATSIQATAIGNVTPGLGYFTTANATTVQAATIGNVGAAHVGSTGTFSGTVIAATVNAATIGNASAVLTGSYGNITTINATNVNATTIGNVGASVVGNGGFLSNIIAANVVGTVTTANVSMYDNVATSTTNATYYPQLADKSSGNVGTVVATSVNVNPSTSTISALGFVGGTGAFTTLSASGVTQITNSTDATSTNTGALQITGGAGILGNLWVGGNIYAGNLIATTTNMLTVQDPLLYLQALGNLSYYNYDIGFYSDYTANQYRHSGLARSFASNTWIFFSNVFSEPSGSAINWNDVGLAYDTVKAGSLILANTTAATSTSSGALQVAGGIGVIGSAYIGGGIQNTIIGNATPATAFFTTANATNVYAATVGNASTTLNGNLIGGNANLTSTTAATSTTTGALVVAGGAGVVGNVYIGGSLVTTGASGNISGVNTVFATTVNATSVNSATIGNIGAYLKGDGSNITNISLGSISGTYPTANVSMYSNVTYLTNNQSYALVFSNIGTASASSGNTILGVSGWDGGLAYNPSTYTLSAGTFSGTTGSFSLVNTTSTIISGGNIVAASSAPSTSITTGSFVAKGGAGIAGNVWIGGITNHAGNVAFDGGQVTHYDSIIDLHTYGNLATWSTDDGKDIGLRMHYYNGADALAFVGLENSTKSLQFLINATEVAGNVTGTFGNAQMGSLLLSNTTTSTSTTTGALQVAGGAGVAGNVYVGGNINVGVNAVVTGTLGVTGDSTLTTGNIGGLQARSIGNVTPGTGAFTTASTTGNLTVGGNITITGNIVPSANITYSLGTSGNRFKDIWLSGQTEYLGGSVIGEGSDGNLNLTTATGNRVTISSTSNVMVATGNIATPYLLGNVYGTTGTFLGTGTSISSTTGAVVVTGGVGVGGNLYVGTNTAITGNLGVTGESTLTTGTIGGLQAKAIGNITPGTYTFTTGNVSGLQALAIGNVTAGTGAFTTLTASTWANITATVPSTSTTTGALVVAGGAGIAGNIYAGATSSVHALQGNLLIGPTQSAINADSPLTINPNTTTPALFANAVVHTTTLDGKNGFYGLDSFGAFAPGVASGFYARRGRGTVASPSALLSGDTIGALNFKGFGSSTFTGAAYAASGIRVGAAENFTDSAQGTYLEILTVPTGTITATQAVFVDTSGNVCINATTASSNTTEGALLVKGGAGIAGRVNIGGNTAVNSTLYGRGVYDNGTRVVSTSSGAGNLTISGTDINLTPVGPGAITTGSASAVPVITTDAYGRITAISTATVAAVATAANVAFYTQTVSLNTNDTFYPTFANVNGGNSIPGTSSLLSYNPGTGTLTASAAAINGGLTSTSTTSGALIVTGGVGISGSVYTGGAVVVNSTTNSTSTGTGALQVVGGMGIAGNVYFGNAAVFNSSQTAGSDYIVRGKNDATLIWARPSASYDTVIIGNSAVAGNVVAGAKLNINTTDSIKLPVGTNSQRPGNQGQTDVAGMFRYSTTQNAVEWYTGTQWMAATTAFTVITDEQFNGDGTTTDFTLAGTTTTAATIVSINGVIQIPTLAYSVVSSTTLRFTEAPASGDIIDVRRLTTTETVVALNDATGYNAVDVDNTDGVTISTGTATKNARYRINTDGAQVSLLANTAIASANVATTIDTMSTGTYRSAKYTVQATNGANYQVMEALLISNGTTATVTAYGTIQTNGNLGIVTATQSGSNAQLQFVALNASTNVRISKEYLLI